MENEEFDAEALNAGLNEDTPKIDPYSKQDEPEDEPEEVETTEPSDDEPEDRDDPEPKTLSKAEQRHQKLANERTAEREQRLLAEQRAQLLERQIEDMRRGQQAPKEEENLDPLEKWQRDANKTLMEVQLRQHDMDDKSKFLFVMSKNPAEAAYVERVEAELAKARQAGHNPTRENILIYIMGQDARAKMAKAPEIKRDAATRVKAATGKPLGTKSNVAPSKSESTEYDRLKGITL